MGQKSLASRKLQAYMFLSYFLTVLTSVILSSENDDKKVYGKGVQALCENETSVLRHEIVHLNKVIEDLKRQLKGRLMMQNVSEAQLLWNSGPLKTEVTQHHMDMKKKNSSESLMEATEIHLQMNMELGLQPEVLQTGELEQKQNCAETSQQLNKCEQRCFEFQIILEKSTQRCEKDKKQLIQQVWRCALDTKRQAELQYAYSSGVCPRVFWLLPHLATMIVFLYFRHGQ